LRFNYMAGERTAKTMWKASDMAICERAASRLHGEGGKVGRDGDTGR